MIVVGGGESAGEQAASLCTSRIGGGPRGARGGLSRVSFGPENSMYPPPISDTY